MLRTFSLLLLVLTGCAAKRTDSGAYMIALNEAYQNMSAEEIEEIECMDTDDMSDKEIRYWQTINGCK